MTNEQAQQFVQVNSEVAQEAQEQMQEILARSVTDLAFREKLLSDPHAAIEEHTGTEVPEDVEISFIENQGDATIVLPDYQDTEAELDEEELETISGGTTIPCGLFVGAVWSAIEHADDIKEGWKEA